MDRMLGAGLLGPRSFFIIALSIFLWALTTDAHAEGAFALGRGANGTWWYGEAHDELSPAAAANLAMARCRQRGPNCQLVKQFNVGCFAYAAPDVTNANGMAMGATQQEAESRALQLCVRYSLGRQCRVQESFCDYSDGPLAQAMSRQLQIESAARQSNRGQSSDGCSIGGKAISYAYRTCAANSQCDAKFGVIEIVGSSVLQYAGVRNGNTGIEYKLGQTTEITQDSRMVRQQFDEVMRQGGPRPPGMQSQDYATSSYDGRRLAMYMTSVMRTANHSRLPAGVLMGFSSMTLKFDIPSCERCAVTDVSLDGYTIGGRVDLPPALTGRLVEQSCKIDSMK